MRRFWIVMTLAGAVAVWCAAPLGSTRAAELVAGGAWGKAIEIPGLGALNTGGDVAVNSVSCGSAGNCVAGGGYLEDSSHSQGFVVGERDGRWAKAIKVPGLGALSTGGNAAVNSVSCSSAGTCAVGGLYVDGHSHSQAFVVSERNGRWGKALEVPGSGALNKGGNAQVSSVSCASAGNCAAGGTYENGSRSFQLFVVSERNGRWGKALEVPGSGALNKGGSEAMVKSVACASAGNCVAGGDYGVGSPHYQAFVVSERNGRWGKALEVPGSATLNRGRAAQVGSVSCASAGNCAAGGFYVDGSSNFQAFVVSERNGRWGKALEVPGSANLNVGGFAVVSSVSCGSVGDCVAGGSYLGVFGAQAFVVSDRNGQWGKLMTVPGSVTLNAGGEAVLNSLSCGSAGNCAAGGSYRDKSGHVQAFVVSERNGRWGKALEVPGLGSLNAGGNAEVNSISCSRAGPCAVVGTYNDRSTAFQGFVVSRS